MALPPTSEHTLQQQLFQEANDALQLRPGAAARIGVNAQQQATAAPGPVPSTDYIVSMQDGKIGSIYFDDYRIRTTHSHGPVVEHADGPNLNRFNINVASAEAAFRGTNDYSNGTIQMLAETAVPDDMPADRRDIAVREQIMDHVDHWIATTLDNAMQIGDEVPDWANHIDGPESVTAFDAPNQPEGQILFEVQHRTDGRPPDRHPSRGAAVSMSIPDRDIDALRAAVDLLEGLPNHQRGDPVRRNELFFNYLGTNAPNLADMIRKP